MLVSLYVLKTIPTKKGKKKKATSILYPEDNVRIRKEKG